MELGTSKIMRLEFTKRYAFNIETRRSTTTFLNISTLTGTISFLLFHLFLFLNCPILRAGSWLLSFYGFFQVGVLYAVIVCDTYMHYCSQFFQRLHPQDSQSGSARISSVTLKETSAHYLCIFLTSLMPFFFPSSKKTGVDSCSPSSIKVVLLPLNHTLSQVAGAILFFYPDKGV